MRTRDFKPLLGPERRFTIKSPIKHEDYPDESDLEEVNPFNFLDNQLNFIIEKGKIEEPDIESE